MSKLAKVLFLCVAISLTTLTLYAKEEPKSKVPTEAELNKKLFAVKERIEKLTVLQHMYRGQLNLLKQIEEEKEAKETKTKSKKSKEKNK